MKYKTKKIIFITTGLISVLPLVVFSLIFMTKWYTWIILFTWLYWIHKGTEKYTLNTNEISIQT